MKKFVSAIHTIFNEARKASFGSFIQSIMLALGVRYKFNAIYTLRSGIRLQHSPHTLDRMVIRECLINDLYTKYLSTHKLSTAIDFGSHKGFFIIGLLSKGIAIDKVICVEPLAENIEAFKTNQNLNPNLFLQVRELQIEASAVSTEIGTATFFLTDNSVNHSLHNPESLSRVTEKRLIPTTTILEILRKNQVGAIDLVKMDIEGTEFDLFGSPEQIQPLLLSKHIIMEIHPDQTHRAAELIAQLVAAQYEVNFPNPAYPDLIYARKRGN